MNLPENFDAILLGQPALSVVDERTKEVVHTEAIGEPVPVDMVSVKANYGDGIAEVTSKSTGNKITVGFTVAYAAGWDNVFGQKPGNN